jgi:hypothetical protein
MTQVRHAFVFKYPSYDPDEDRAQYWARVHAMGLPMPWQELDTVQFPGRIEAVTEWGTTEDIEDPEATWKALDKTQAIKRQRAHPHSVVVSRQVWKSFGPWGASPKGA